jgi:hypothetical protein
MKFRLIIAIPAFLFAAPVQAQFMGPADVLQNWMAGQQRQQELDLTAPGARMADAAS